jgi:competence protein ComEA
MDLPPARHAPDDEISGWTDTPSEGWRDALRAWVTPSRAERIGMVVLLVGALAATAALVLDAHGRPAPAGDEPFPAAADWDAELGGPVIPDASVTVHVAGAVREPGVRWLAAGARVGDAIAAAGGALPDAMLDRVNLARPLTDGEQVRVPGRDDPVDEQGTGHDGRIDVNRADVTTLQQLPGIGPSRAAAIVEHRERHGPFRVPGDLRDVTGIGEATFQRLAPLVVVG